MMCPIFYESFCGAFFKKRPASLLLACLFDSPKACASKTFCGYYIAFQCVRKWGKGIICGKVAIGEIIQNLLIKYMVCDIIKMDIYNWYIYAFSAVLCY